MKREKNKETKQTKRKEFFSFLFKLFRFSIKLPGSQVTPIQTRWKAILLLIRSMLYQFEQQEIASETPETHPASTDQSEAIIPESEYVAMEAEEDEIMEDTEEAVKTLPLSKVKRIFKLDPEYSGAAASATYATAVATELFVQYLAEQSAMIARTERRKKIQYKDVNAAASSQEALYFLSDTIPKTQQVGEAIKQKKINITNDDQIKLATNAQETDQNTAMANVPETTDVASPQVVPELPRGQTTLPFEVVPVKKAVLLDLISTDEPMAID